MTNKNCIIDAVLKIAKNNFSLLVNLLCSCETSKSVCWHYHYVRVASKIFVDVLQILLRMLLFAKLKVLQLVCQSINFQDISWPKVFFSSEITNYSHSWSRQLRWVYWKSYKQTNKQTSIQVQQSTSSQLYAYWNVSCCLWLNKIWRLHRGKFRPQNEFSFHKNCLQICVYQHGATFFELWKNK